MFRSLLGHHYIYLCVLRCRSFVQYEFILKYLSICVSIYLWLYSPLLALGRFFSFFIFYTVGRTPWTGDQPVTRPRPAHRTAQTQNKHTQTSMPQMGFEPTIPVFERTKTVHALDCTATVIGILKYTILKFYQITSHQYVNLISLKDKQSYSFLQFPILT
jgi:beta-lactamase regulating signal transducer with metallopeptidase domain